MSRKTDVLVLGSGGREHALAWKLSRSPGLGKLFCAPGSDAIAGHAACVRLDILDAPAVTGFCGHNGIGLVVVGPEAPLEAGVADALRREGVPVFGPGRDAARLETSKVFAKDFMARHGIPTAGHRVASSAAAAKEALRTYPPDRYPVVLKADGLAQGKGVRICEDRAEALGAVDDFMESKSLGRAGETIVLEECLEGPELSVMALVDGKSFSLLPFSRDHKRLGDGNTGPNTGGMGAFAPVAVDADLARRIEGEVLTRCIEGLARDGLDYRGVLYAGLMLTVDGPKTLEFNCRFGDPEAQAVLPLLQEDLLEVLLEVAGGNLSGRRVKSSGDACLCVVMASEGYPNKPVVGQKIDGLEAAPDDGLMVFHSGTARSADGWITKGGRVLGVTASAPSLAGAREKAYAGVSRIRFDGMQCRRDVGAGMTETSGARR
ncbi:MAG: phosphoribosylamine--glycine ligase [Elusimicrobia bacterium]|nr:phosphoribosylamine--glycine ligase [Elusimicrobiota bacterium]